jgi:hypothetical protein
MILHFNVEDHVYKNIFDTYSTDDEDDNCFNRINVYKTINFTGNISECTQGISQSVRREYCRVYTGNIAECTQGILKILHREYRRVCISECTQRI